MRIENPDNPDQFIYIDDKALNEAKWTACNTRFLKGPVPSMEDLSEAVQQAIETYLIEAVGWQPPRPKRVVGRKLK